MEIPRKPIVEWPFSLRRSIYGGQIVLQCGRQIVGVATNVDINKLQHESNGKGYHA